MKQFLGSFKRKLVGEQGADTKDRAMGFGFQIGVTAFLITAILCITWYLIKVLP